VLLEKFQADMSSKTKKKIPYVLVITLMMPLILAMALVYSVQIHSSYAQNDTSSFGQVTSVYVNGKNYPIKYSITTGKLLGVVEDKDKTTLIAVVSTPSDKGTLNIEIPRNILDDKGQSNVDAKFTVRVDGKDATFRETANNKVARTLAIDFNKDARLIEIIGTQASTQ
jgi:hypothetical protein